MADKYVQNNHTNGIRVSITVGGKKYDKRFPVQGFDLTGKIVETGYTRLTEKEYEACGADKLFTYFVKIGKLIVHDSLPASAMSPHDALVSARKESGKFQARISELEKENSDLQKQLADAEARYTELAAASEKTGKKGR